jgi:DNA-directed RNA polymerase sigma subunit (sigma70/sigma32)
MTPFEIKKIVEDFPNYLEKKEKLQNRIISLSGRDPEQETVLLQRLEYLEQRVEVIDFAIHADVVLTTRENHAVWRRSEGDTYQKIGDIYNLTREAVRVILAGAYKKISRVSSDDLCIE